MRISLLVIGWGVACLIIGCAPGERSSYASLEEFAAQRMQPKTEPPGSSGKVVRDSVDRACRPTLVPCAPVGEAVRVESADGQALARAIGRLDERRRTIELPPGLYRVTSLDLYASGTQDRPLTLRGADPDDPPILDFGFLRPGPVDGRNPGVNLEGSWWLLENLVIRHARNAVFLVGQHITLRRTVVEDVSGEAVMVAQVSEGFARVAENVIRRVGLAPESGHPQGRHGVYVGNDGRHLTREVQVVDNTFLDLSGAAVHVNGSRANEEHPDRWPASEDQEPEYGIASMLVENNVAVNSREGVNLYRFVFDSRVANNTMLMDRSGPSSRLSGQFVQIRNAARNEITANLFLSDLPSRHVLVGYRETPGAPPNGANRLAANVWCVGGRARFSWDHPGAGVEADRPLRSYAKVTGDSLSLVATTSDSEACQTIWAAMGERANENGLRALDRDLDVLEGIGAGE